MFYSSDAKDMSVAVSQSFGTVYAEVEKWFELATLNSTGEVDFVRELVAATHGKSFALPQNRYRVSVNSRMLHMKPYVIFDMAGSRERCELADLLVTVNYEFGGRQSSEKKSILYQAKVQSIDGPNLSPFFSWGIQENQNYCLSVFPEMWFGTDKKAAKPSSTLAIWPITIEFGSYLLLSKYKSSRRWRALGATSQGDFLAISPSSRRVLLQRCASKATETWAWPIMKTHDSAYLNFSRHIAFDLGEHHDNAGIGDFIDAILAAAHPATAPSQAPSVQCFITRDYSGDGKPNYPNIDIEKDGSMGVIEITVRADKT